MNLLELVLISITLALDCLAVAICISSVNKLQFSDFVKIPGFFAVFQAGMTVLGFFIGLQFKQYVTSFGDWIAFVLLATIGLKIVYDSFKNETQKISLLSFVKLVLLSIATSIDAFVIGITLSLLSSSIAYTAIVIGLITFAISLYGLLLGNSFFNKLKYMNIVSGFVLIGIGLKIIVSSLI